MQCTCTLEFLVKSHEHEPFTVLCLHNVHVEHIQCRPFWNNKLFFPNGYVTGQN